MEILVLCLLKSNIANKVWTILADIDNMAMAGINGSINTEFNSATIDISLYQPQTKKISKSLEIVQNWYLFCLINYHDVLNSVCDLIIMMFGILCMLTYHDSYSVAIIWKRFWMIIN